jgi:hypothetical protein
MPIRITFKLFVRQLFACLDVLMFVLSHGMFHFRYNIFCNFGCYCLSTENIKKYAVYYSGIFFVIFTIRRLVLLGKNDFEIFSFPVGVLL